MTIGLWPRNLVGQLLLAVAATLFLAQAINLALLVRGQRQQALAHGGGMAVARFIDAMDGGAGRTDRGRDRMIRVPRLQSSDAPIAIPSGALPEAALAANVADLLVEAGVRATNVRAYVIRPAPRARSSSPVNRVAIVYATIDGRNYAVRSRLPAEGKRLRGFLIWQTLTLFALLFVPILFIAWRAARPLRELTRAARGDVLNGDAPPIVERGPSDVRDLITAFNAYRARNHLMLADKDRMLGAVGHDLRTPLASLRVRVEGVEDPALRGKMIATIDEMTAMLADILALARTGAGKEAAEAYDIAALLHEVANEYRIAGSAVEGPGKLPQLPPMTGRPLLVRRALRNLIDNAISYAGSATLDAVVMDGVVHLIVRDKGPGIDPARIEELVEPFARGEASRNRATGGAGLGLAIASNLAEGEGGRLSLTNRADGTGLEAAILLPQQ